MSATEIIRKSPSQGDASKFASKALGEKVLLQTSSDIFAQPAEPKRESSLGSATMLEEKVSKHLETFHLLECKEAKDSEDGQKFEQQHSDIEATVTGPQESNLGKRKLSYSNENNNKKFPRKRRKTVEKTRTVSKFLLGGNINDPLNLNSLADEEVSKAVNAQTPLSSPLPERNKDPDPVIVPQDLRDPLKLNSDTDESPSLTKVLPRKRKRRNSHRSSKAEASLEGANEDSSKPNELPLSKDLLTVDVRSHQIKVTNVDKIVSPVIPEACRKRKNKRKSDPSASVAKALSITSDEKKHSTSTAKDRKHGRHKSPVKSKLTDDHPLPKFREKEKQYRYGNYVGYYGYRNTDEEDVRLTYFRRHWFEGKTCLDIGCNTGHVTLYVAKTFQPTKIVGMDIDAKLISLARKSIRQHLEQVLKAKGGASGIKFPVSMAKCFGALPVSPHAPASSSVDSETKTQNLFPQNVLFRCGNFVLSRDDLLETQQEEYDTILCLSITKWIHLNWGDDGLKRFFRRIYLALRLGGVLILEPQAWPSYTKKKKMTETTYRNYHQIKFKPNDFKGFLLQDVGFSSCEVIGIPVNQSKGFRRPLLLFKKLTRKPISTMPNSLTAETASPRADDSSSQFSTASSSLDRDEKEEEGVSNVKPRKVESKIVVPEKTRGHISRGDDGERPTKISKKK